MSLLSRVVRHARNRAPAAGPTSSRPTPAESAVEAETRELRRQVAELKQKREILRRAAKYFAGETNW